MAISKVTYAGNTLIDLTGDTVTPENLLSGATAHAANGEEITGIVEDKKGELEAQIEDLRNQIGSLNANLANTMYPVGSIYLSVNATNPAELFGGTWERIKDRFLLASGDTYAAGDSGGSASHSHTLSANGAACIGNFATVTAFSTGAKYWWNNYNTGTNIWVWTHNSDSLLTHSTDHYNDGSFVGLTGSTDSDNSMPPYLAVYMWKRTA